MHITFTFSMQFEIWTNCTCHMLFNSSTDTWTDCWKTFVIWYGMSLFVQQTSIPEVRNNANVFSYIYAIIILMIYCLIPHWNLCFLWKAKYWVEYWKKIDFGCDYFPYDESWIEISSRYSCGPIQLCINECTLCEPENQCVDQWLILLSLVCVP